VNKYKYLLKNIGLLTISNFGSKILSFLIVPLYTAILTTEEYGTYDLLNTTISLLIPICTLNICEAVLRFALEKKSDNKIVFSEALKIITLSMVIIIAIVLVNNKIAFSKILKMYSLEFVALYFSTLVYTFMSNFARGVDKVSVVAIAGIINTLTILGLNVFFLVCLGWKLEGYFAAMILGSIVPSVYMFLGLKAWKYITFNIKDTALVKGMLNYSTPLVANAVAWWVNSALDRYVIVWICGVAANGIYSVSYKIPSILNILSNIFNQAWVLSSVKAYEKDDEQGFFARIYETYNMILVFACSFLIIITKIASRVLFAKDFYAAWEYVPFLLISVIFGAMSGFIGGIFSAVKDSKIYATSTSIGAFVNFVLNIFLVGKFGPIGAAAATLVSYFVVWVLRMVTVRKYIKLRIDYKMNIIGYVGLLLQAVILIAVRNNYILYSVEGLFFAMLIVNFRKPIREMLVSLKVRVKE